METTARDFTRNFRKLRAAAARGRTVRVTAPEGTYLFIREGTAKTCGNVLEKLKAWHGRGFLTEDGARAIAAGRRRRVLAKSPWDVA